jgi:hypothetical protein
VKVAIKLWGGRALVLIPTWYWIAHCSNPGV